MKKTRNFRHVRFTLLLLAGSLCVGRLTAQAGEPVSAGKFTLPFEVRWGQAILPAGDYTYTLNSATFSGVVTVRGNSKAVMILVGSVEQRKISDQSHLTVLRTAVGGRVRSLYLGHLGLEFNYPIPKADQQFTAEEPVHIQRVPVYLAAK
jgi:hypothetical protein